MATDQVESGPKWMTRGPDGTVFITEGKAKILFPSENSVFYNPVQEFNRDMSIAAIRTWSEIAALEHAKRQQTPVKAAQQLPVIAATDATSRPLAQIKITYEDHTKSFGEEDLEEPNWESDELKDWNFAILEALSATGLRSIRYAKDIPRLRHIIANDLLDDAVEAIKRNAEDNGVAGIVQPNKGDASAVMYQAIGTGFDVIDLDPYGSATQFLDGAVQAVAEGGLLCITCTDLAVLAGSQADACFAKYGAMSLPNSPFCHELALRILLHSTQQAASRYKRVIVPMLSLSIDFYVRVFVRVFTSPGLVKRVAGKTSMVYQCTGCRSFVTHPLGKSPEHGDGNKIGPITGPPVNNKCEHCNRPFHTAGPFWSAPIHNAEFVHRMLKHVKSTDASTYGTKARMTGMLSVVSEELPVPLYYNIATLSSTVHTQSLPILKIMSALLNMGYKASLTHASTNCIKTDASPQALWDIIRAWVKLNPVKNIKEEAPAGYILKQDSKHTVSFDLHPNADPPSRKIKLVRHQNNPTKYWGPMARAGRRDKKGSASDKQASGEATTKPENDPLNSVSKRPFPQEEDDGMHGKRAKADSL